MEQVLSELGLQYLKSETNFIFHKTPVTLKKYRELMQQNYVLIGKDFALKTS